MHLQHSIGLVESVNSACEPERWDQSSVTWLPALRHDLNFRCNGLGPGVGKNVVCLRGTRGHGEFMSSDKEKNCRVALFIFVHSSSVCCQKAIPLFPFVFALLHSYFSPSYLCVCVFVTERIRDCVGEILYQIFGNIWKEMCTIKGYVGITGQPGVTDQHIHLLWLHLLLPVSWTHRTTHTIVHSSTLQCAALKLVRDAHMNANACFSLI